LEALVRKGGRPEGVLAETLGGTSHRRTSQLVSRCQQLIISHDLYPEESILTTLGSNNPLSEYSGFARAIIQNPATSSRRDGLIVSYLTGSDRRKEVSVTLLTKIVDAYVDKNPKRSEQKRI
jgi:hypothetical protein